MAEHIAGWLCTPSQKAEVAEFRPSWRVEGVYTLMGGQLLAPHTKAKWMRWSTGLTTCTQAIPVSPSQTWGAGGGGGVYLGEGAAKLTRCLMRPEGLCQISTTLG